MSLQDSSLRIVNFAGDKCQYGEVIIIRGLSGTGKGELALKMLAQNNNNGKVFGVSEHGFLIKIKEYLTGDIYHKTVCVVGKVSRFKDIRGLAYFCVRSNIGIRLITMSPSPKLEEHSSIVENLKFIGFQPIR